MNKTSNLRIRVEPELHESFLRSCKSRDVAAAQVLRSFMRKYVKDQLDGRQPDLFIDSPANMNGIHEIENETFLR